MTTRQRWIALVVLCLAELLVSIDNTIVNVALPTLSRQLGASTGGLQWIVDAYTLVFAGLLLAAGHLGDRLGRRRTLLLGLAGFGATSAVAATLTGLGGLIAARAVMGGFAALIFPATLAILTQMFTVTRERVAAIGVWSAIAGLAVAIGPVTGGWLLEHFSWHSVFWVNVPLVVLAIVLTVTRVPESRDPSVGRLDIVGVLLSVGAIVTLVWSVIEGPNNGWTSAIELTGFAGAAVLLAAFVAWESRHPHPVLSIALFANRRFSAGAGAISVAFFGLFGFIFVVTQYFQVVRGYGTLDAGLRTLPFAIVIGAVAPLAVQVAARVGSTTVVSGGLVLMAAGFGLAATLPADAAYFGPVVLSMTLMAAGLGLVSGPATEAIMGALPRETAGAGSAVNDTTREVGGTLGVAVMGSVMSAIYGGKLVDALHGMGLDHRTQDTARSSVAAGFEVAQRLHSPQVAAAVRSAFLSGMHTASWVAAGATLAGAVLVAFALPARGVERATEPVAPEGATELTAA